MRLVGVAGVEGLGGELGVLGDGDFGAAGVEGGAEGLDEGLRGAGDEVEVDVDPVGAGGVVDDGPALEGGGGFGVPGIGEEDAVGGFPDGDFGDVGDAEVALAGAAIEQGEVAEALAAVVGEQLEVAVDVALEGGVKELDGDGGGELEGAGGAGVRDDGEETAVGFGVGSSAWPLGTWGGDRWRGCVR